jgi:hypothetical protein
MYFFSLFPHPTVKHIEIEMRTSLNLHRKTMAHLLRLKNSYYCTFTSTIKRAIRLYVDNMSSGPAVSKTVSYQKKQKSDNWHQFNIVFTQNEYEHFTDYRNLYKLSLSHLVSLAVSFYYNSLKKMDHFCWGIHNYVPSLFPVYIINTHVNNGIERVEILYRLE